MPFVRAAAFLSDGSLAMRLVDERFLVVSATTSRTTAKCVLEDHAQAYGWWWEHDRSIGVPRGMVLRNGKLIVALANGKLFEIGDEQCRPLSPKIAQGTFGADRAPADP